MTAARPPARTAVATTAALAVTLLGVWAAPAAQAGTADGACPTGFELVTVKYVLRNTGGAEDPSMDGNDDGFTCLKLLDTGSGTRATWHDNVLAE